MHETINQYEIKCKYVDVVKNILCFLLLQFLNKLHFQNSDLFDLTERTEDNKKPISDEIWEKQS